MTFEEGMKKSIENIEKEKCELLGLIQEKDKAIEELVEKKTALEKRCFELEQENEALKMGLQYDSDNRDDILNENSDLQQKYLKESFEKSNLVKEKSNLCEQNNELVEENGTLKTQVSILQGKNKGLEELVKGYENTRDRMIAMGFPTFKSFKEYAVKLKDLEKAYNETQELLDKQIEATYKLDVENEKLKKENTELKEIIENIIRVTWGEGWNYSLDWKVKAEQFLMENEKHHHETEVINGRPTGKAILVPDNLAYAKSIIEQLMNMKNLSGNEQIEVIKKAKAFLH